MTKQQVVHLTTRKVVCEGTPDECVDFVIEQGQLHYKYEIRPHVDSLATLGEILDHTLEVMESIKTNFHNQPT